MEGSLSPNLPASLIRTLTLKSYFKRQSFEERNQNPVREVTGPELAVQKYGMGTGNEILFLSFEVVLPLPMKIELQHNMLLLFSLS